MPWTAADIPDQTGRTILVTGATSGLGLETARALAPRGATLVLAARSADKAQQVLDELLPTSPGGTVSHLLLDLSSLDGIASAAKTFLAEHDRLDVLVNNAGVMATPERRTADGFELQVGTNHLGHFALTGHLMPALLGTDASRVVTVSSGMHRVGSISFDDLNWQRRRYRKWFAYGQSKLANLLFMSELQSRLAEHGAGTISVAAHPGFASTHLQAAGPQMQGGTLGRLQESAMRAANRTLAQSAAMGALPQLYAATATDVPGGSYWGPDGPGEQRGHPARAARSSRAKDIAAAQRLWMLSEDLTGVHFPFER